MFSEEVLHFCEEERLHTVTSLNCISEIHLGAAIHRFFFSLAVAQQTFSVISDPAFAEAK